MRRKWIRATLLLWVASAGAGLGRNRLWGATGELELRVVDHDSGRPIAVRMHLKDGRGRAQKPPGVPFWRDHFVFDGKIVLRLPAGQYRFQVERGPEYRLRTGQFTIKPNAADNKQVEMVRFVDMKTEGWWSGELHIHRPLDDIRLLMRAEDLHIGPVITWWNRRNLWKAKPLPDNPLVRFDHNRFYHVMAGEDEREGGALMYFNLNRPLPIAQATREYPSPMEFLNLARRHEGVHVDVEKPFWWDMPVWVASGKVDSIGLCNNHMQRDGMLDGEAWGKPRDKSRYPSPLGNGQWSVEIYYRLLNCGLRIPPSAGSASGVLNNPVGYNRVYVHCGDQLNYNAWWEGLRAGRVVVTNGPLLRPRVNGQLPGYVFQADQGRVVELDIALKLATRDRIDYLEVVQNGRVVEKVPLAQWARQSGRLPKLRFQQSGWMLVRAVTNNQKTYRFASTGPYYVEIGGKRRISRSAARFFLDWVEQRISRIRLDDPDQRREVLQDHLAARKFWQDRLANANAD